MVRLIADALDHVNSRESPHDGNSLKLIVTPPYFA